MSRGVLRGPNRTQFELHSRRRDLAPGRAACSTFLVRADAVITALTYLGALGEPEITVVTKAQLLRGLPQTAVNEIAAAGRGPDDSSRGGIGSPPTSGRYHEAN